jgi:hypothetical protein
MSAVVVPAGLIDVIRDGLRGQISVAAALLVEAEVELGAREHPERYQRPLASIDALRALLGEIGWDTPPRDLQIDLEIHGWALIHSIDDRIEVLIDRLAEIDRNPPGDVQSRAIVAGQAAELHNLARTTMALLGQSTQTDFPAPDS